MKRIIGSFSGDEKGPLLIVFGAMHGNEAAGIKAMDLMLKMIEVEPITNPAFHYKGKVIGLIGNLGALKRKKRFINKDLNRCWTVKNVNKAERKEKIALNEELQEIKECMKVIRKEIAEYQPEKLYVLDLHTTSSSGGIFTIVPENPESINIAIELEAPVITNMTQGLTGTSMQYFNTENMGVETVSLTFESGQHDDPLSVNRAIAAITNCMKIIGSIDGRHIENRHNNLLTEYSKNLPKLSKLLLKYEITRKDQFVMKPGYYNFKEVKEGEILGKDKRGDVKSPFDGLILMPLYQKLGNEGFFLVEEIPAK